MPIGFKLILRDNKWQFIDVSTEGDLVRLT